MRSLLKIAAAGKKTNAFRSRTPFSELTEDEKNLITRLSKDKVPQRDIAKMLNRGYSTVNAIINKKERKVKEGFFDYNKPIF
jgi:IS30 family transposase